MKADGYNTKAPNTHEISVAFIKDNYREYGESLVDDFNRFRRMRNESKYRAYYVSREVTKESFRVAGEYVRITRLIFDSKFQ
jgi:sulfite reductase beta subunit-like hemoprotein